MFLTDDGSENVNSYVYSLLNSRNATIINRVAQLDVVFSNSMIETFNKTLKYEFLHPYTINNGKTPNETFNGIAIDFKQYNRASSTKKT